MIVEVLHGEGGADSKAFAGQLAEVYRRYAAARHLSAETLDDEDGHHVLKVTGQGAGRAFAGEAGKHCVQRIPENDRSGRRQTSFVTVAVLPLPPDGTLRPLPEGELEVKTQTGKQKAGGRNANCVNSAVRMKHVPTGLTVFINGRDQVHNRKTALRVLTAKVHELRTGRLREAYAEQKAAQLADRGRGGKVRTYSFIERFVADHRTGRRTTNVKAVMKGELSLVL